MLPKKKPDGARRMVYAVLLGQTVWASTKVQWGCCEDTCYAKNSKSHENRVSGVGLVRTNQKKKMRIQSI
jgi:hypothetical protein